ncbi:MAG: DUF2442 domain-containing protein [bacterium]
MHFVTSVCCEADYKLRVSFEDGSVKIVDLADHLEGEMFLPLKDLKLFRSAHLNPDLDTVVWDNGSDMSPDFLYATGITASKSPELKVAEPPAHYG